MEMQQLRYVVAVARTGNFSRAALQCHVSQPSLSQQIQKLEDELGERLFERLQREAKLTAVGEAFLRRAVRILEEADAAQREAQEARELHRGVVTLGVLPTIAPYLLPAVMRQFTAGFPGVQLDVQEDTTAQLVKLCLSYELDFAIASNTIHDERLESEELGEEELKLALPLGHPLEQRPQIALTDLEKEQLIVLKDGHCLGEQVLRFCDRHHFTPNISFRSAQLETIQSLVQAGLGISLVPATAAHAEGLVYRSLAAPAPQRKIMAVWHKQRPPQRGAREFLRFVRAHYRAEAGG
jgi:LysR family transcriptional regulator, hydrogen peroxide-inducible genes activator